MFRESVMSLNFWGFVTLIDLQISPDWDLKQEMQIKTPLKASYKAKFSQSAVSAANRIPS